MRVVVVGAGVLGSMHALTARRRGFDVVHLERDLAARGASVRNFGLVWVGARAGGAELQLALRARSLWEKLAPTVPGALFRPVGSLTVATDEAELALMHEAYGVNRAAEAGAGAGAGALGGAGALAGAVVAAGGAEARRQWQLLDGPAARGANPELSEAVLGALWCGADALLEPRTTVAAICRHLASEDGEGYRSVWGRAVLELREGAVVDDHGEVHQGDWVFLCTGAASSSLLARYVDRPRTRLVRLQMLETEPYPGDLATAVADGDSMRYYPAYDLPARAGLAPQPPTAARAHAQVLVVQRSDGRLTIGDTHDYTEPFPFDLEETVYEHLLAKAGRLLRRPIPPVARRWAGVYSQLTDRGEGLYWREELVPGVEVVSGPGGLGMTCAPAIADDSVSALAARVGL